MIVVQRVSSAFHMRQRLASGLRTGRCNARAFAVSPMSMHTHARGTLRSRRVAVIGAGAAGLAAARELRSEGHLVTVLEQSSHVGGVWRYDPNVESEDLLGRDPDRPRVHSSMYRQLRTNLPRELMSYMDFPFDAAFLGPRYSTDARRFCGHAEVLGYLEAFADYYELRPLVRFRTRVLSVELAGPEEGGTALTALRAPADGEPREPVFGWAVTTTQSGLDAAAGAEAGAAAAAAAGCGGAAAAQRELYDAVVVCNGHYSEPRLPEVKGMAEGGGASVFPGQQLHSHNYRSPEQWRGKVVLVVGASNSGEDLSRELSAGGAARVLLSAWSWKNEAWGRDAAPYGPGGNIHRYPMVSELHADGTATFADGRREGPIDAVIYCTGYRYSFPFLRGAAAAAAAVRDNCVGPLWLHMLPPGPLAPGLAFVGLPWKVVPFPQFQMQSKLIARLLSGQAQLPSREQMEADIEAHFEAMRAQQLPSRYAHMQGQTQFAYNDLLARLCGPDVKPLPRWRAELNRITGEFKRKRPEDYRDADLSSCDSDAANVLQAAAADIMHQVEHLTGVIGGNLDSSMAHRAEDTAAGTTVQLNVARSSL